ncbi:hypothetical protein EUTSA_v10009250mg [Eutrema salsugineum]|uniref:Uncharacterized protein n=1 Tax=Eutrema salsugineum TaxID=72664 RepID=V4KYF0_EUTSA|nr:hypothetical protein EUTSA_v10009250mg [Eutrema salsugineum]
MQLIIDQLLSNPNELYGKRIQRANTEVETLKSFFNLLAICEKLRFWFRKKLWRFKCCFFLFLFFFELICSVWFR